MYLQTSTNEENILPSIYYQEINISNTYEKNIVREKNIITNNLLKNTALLSLLEKQDKQLVAVLTDEQKAGLRSDLFKFSQDKNGNLFADLRKTKNGQIVSKVNLKEIDISSSDLNKISNIVLEQKLNEVMKDLELIKEGISDILAGQHNDRIAKSKSAYSQYLLLNKVDDLEIRKMIVQNVINKSTESFFAIAETLNYNISKFKDITESVESGYKKLIQETIGIDDKKIQALADDIFKQMEALFFSSMVRSLAYSELGNSSISAMPINDLNLFLDINLDKRLAYELNSWISINNNFWTKEYLPHKEKISEKLKIIEKEIFLIEEGV